eukprot:jgi/Mesen1/3971/ME000210S03214
MTMESLVQLESLCEKLYNAQDPAERAHAEQTLQVFSVNSEYITQCQFILDSSSSPYAQLLAASSLVKQVTDHALSVQLRLDIRNYVLSFLASKGPELQTFVTSALIQLLCRITKLGWYDDDCFRDIVKETMKFLTQATVEHFYIGLKILNQLVAEMNQASAGRSLTHHRKTACSFRDLALFQTFQISLTSLKQLQTDGETPSTRSSPHGSASASLQLSSARADDKLREQAIALALKCLSFDFVGTSLDESSEDLGTIQIPSAWRPVLEDTSTMQLFFDYYTATKPPLSNQALECLVRLASVRRSLFSGEPERLAFLTRLMNGTRDILRSQQGLSEHENYHEYCRLLGRLKTNYQLSELVNVENYNEWVQLVADFTIKSLQSWQWASGSVYYLLGLWSRLVSSMPYLKSDSPSLLESYVPKITEAYITSRLDSVQAVLQNNLAEDPLDNEEHLSDQLDSLPYLCRFQDAARLPGGSDSNPVIVMEGQLTWLVHIIGAIIKGRLSSSSAETQEVIDGELSARVFQLIQLTDTGSHSQRYHQRSKQRLDLAILSFFQSFRRVYVGDQAMHSSKALYSRLSDLLGLQDHLMVLNVIIGKIATNLKCYTQCEEVIEQTLNLFQELAAGYMSGKLLLKLDAIKFILGNHTREHFPFLDEYSSSRNRTIFYSTLGRLLFMEDSPTNVQVLMNLEATPDAAFRSDAVKYATVGLMRDLRGIAMATNSRRTYGLLFDWLYPAHTPLLLRAVEHWTDTPELARAYFALLEVLCHNHTQVVLKYSSATFSHVVSSLEAGLKCLDVSISSQPNGGRGWPAYATLPPVHTCVYGPPRLHGALRICPLSFGDSGSGASPSWGVPSQHCQRRLFIRTLCGHPRGDFSLGELTLSLIGNVVSPFVCSEEAQCASAVDNLAAFYFTNVVAGEAPTSPAALNMARHMADCPTLFPEILKSLFEIVLFEECANQWSLSRPMLSLILISEQVLNPSPPFLLPPPNAFSMSLNIGASPSDSLFNDLKSQILATQPVDQQPRLAGCFDKLMADVSRTLEPKNRDKFTQNLTIFRHDFRAK